MSIALIVAVWNSTLADPTQVEVLSRLANFADDFGENCFPGIALLAKMTRRSERTVIRTLQELERGGWVSIERGGGRNSRGDGIPSCYHINAAKLKECQDVTLAKPKRRVTLTTPTVTPATKKGDIDDNPPHPLFGRSVKEPSRNLTPPTPSRGEGDALSRAADQVMSALGLTKRRDRRRLRAVIELEAEKGEPPPTIALSMIAAYRKQDGARLRGELTSSYGVMNFFERGVWKNEGRWHWNEELLRQQSLAGVGSRR